MNKEYWNLEIVLSHLTKPYFKSKNLKVGLFLSSKEGLNVRVFVVLIWNSRSDAL